MSSVPNGPLAIQPPEAPFNGTLDDWLAWQQQLHTCDIALGLDRIRVVAQRLGVLTFGARCVTVVGTNGKGSCVGLIESLLQEQGYRVGAYTSPHLWRYNERVRVDGKQATDAQLCTAFAAVESAREDVALTYFEFGTLATLWLFQQALLDYVVLEAGLGGRLDAVNIIDADVALITNIGLDHTRFLGDTREAIGFEKAGIMRTGQPVVCAQPEVPQSVTDHAEAVGATLYQFNDAFTVDGHVWRDWAEHRISLPEPWPSQVLPMNLAAALAVMTSLEEMPRSVDSIRNACQAQQQLRGRCEIVADGAVPIIYDVGHNAEAVAPLLAYLHDHPVAGATHVVIGMLSDKPVERLTSLLSQYADHFYATDLSAVTDRGIDDATLARRIGPNAEPSGTPAAGLARAQAVASPGDRIVVCGSFFMIANARKEPC